MNSQTNHNPVRVIISGGGTGGHIYPAISISNEIKKRMPDAEILFVGAEGKMEMEKVPKAGYQIEGLPVFGFSRKRPWKNIKVLFRLFESLRRAKKIIKKFNPDIAIGVGGYASGPIMKKAKSMGVPILIQEQNSYAGLTNRLLDSKETTVCVAYEGMERFFPKSKIIITGNPCRQNLMTISDKRDDALRHFGLSPEKKTILILTGSLGARTINDTVKAGLSKLGSRNDIQVLWQCGGMYYQELLALKKDNFPENVKLYDFIYDMDLAYSAADLIISRAGASSVSELCLVGKPVILVPSPNVSENHQYKNAKVLEDKNAAVLVLDSQAGSSLLDEAMRLIDDDGRQKELSSNIKQLARPDASRDIVNEIMKILNKK